MIISYPVGLYDVIVVDPPWSYGKKTEARTKRYQTQIAAQHYEVQGQDGQGEINRKTGAGLQTIIDAVPIKEWGAKNSHLYLWTTNPKLPFAFRVMEAWGFTYKTTITWGKIRKDGQIDRGGQGWFFRGATEHVIFGVRGQKPIPAELREPNIILARKTGHSRKPDEFYELIDRITPVTDRRLDVYARRDRAGWDCWGDELRPELCSET